MSEKRFIVESVEITDCCTSRIEKVITDTRELYSYEDLYELCDDINKLNDENEQLQSTITHLEEEIGARENDYVNLKKQFHKIPKNIREVWKE